MAGSSFVDYIVARKIASASDVRTRRYLLYFSLILNFSFLGVFKYFNFFVDSAAHLAALLGLKQIPVSLWRILLPPGISFYTFQEVAYIVDVYHRKVEPAKSLVDYALFISLFPHLIAGPIQRPGHLLPQVQRPRTYDAQSFFSGLMLIATGLVRKCVLADNCALLANSAFSGQLGEPSAAVALIGAYAFAWQIYA